MKVLKKITALVLFAALAASLTSCLALEKAKAHHMIYKDDNFDTIIFNEKTYKEMSNTKYALSAFYYNDDIYRVTDSDVPVLLSEDYGAVAQYDKKLDVIKCGNYYCPEDEYDEFQKMLNESDIDTVCLAKDRYYEISSDEEWLVPLSEETSRAIFELLESEPLDEDTADLIIRAGYNIEVLYLTDKDLAVIDEDASMSLYIFKDKLYIRDNDNKTYAVPDELQEQIKEKIGYEVDEYDDYIIVY